MAAALSDVLGNRLSAGLVITKHAPGILPSPLLISESQFTILEGGHPLPDARSLLAGDRIRAFLSGMTSDDLLVCLLSGGGSALVSAPVEGISLSDLQELTSSLLVCGARISEINTLRRHLDSLKGGGLARLAAPARVVSLILSDVVGNPLETIASGPTSPDPTTCQDALDILVRYSLLDSHSAIVNALKTVPETHKSGDPLFTHVQNLVIGDNLKAAQAGLRQADAEGFHPYLLRADLQGEARLTAVDLCRTLRWAWQTGDPAPRPACIVAGGETTVTLCPHPGLGGRNTEMALAAVTELANFPGVMLATLATDGEDSSTGAAGAVVTGETYLHARALGLNPADYLSRNDSYHFFEGLNDLFQIGPTGTNVNDLIFLFTF
jgi:hydroxypyruvate reductase